MLTGYGLDLGLAGRVASEISKRPEAALRMRTRKEFGVNPQALASLWVAAGSSMVSFALGSVIPLVPYFAAAQSLVLSEPGVLGAGVGGRPVHWRRRGGGSPAGPWCALACVSSPWGRPRRPSRIGSVR